MYSLYKSTRLDESSLEASIEVGKQRPVRVLDDDDVAGRHDNQHDELQDGRHSQEYHDGHVADDAGQVDVLRQLALAIEGHCHRRCRLNLVRYATAEELQ